jgi:hypothetical protein
MGESVLSKLEGFLEFNLNSNSPIGLRFLENLPDESEAKVRRKGEEKRGGGKGERKKEAQKIKQSWKSFGFRHSKTLQPLSAYTYIKVENIVDIPFPHFKFKSSCEPLQSCGTLLM